MLSACPAAISNTTAERSSGQVGLTHEVTVALAGGAAAFVESPNHQALAAAAVASGKDPVEIGRVFIEIGLDVGARVAMKAQFFEQRLFGA